MRSDSVKKILIITVLIFIYFTITSVSLSHSLQHSSSVLKIQENKLFLDNGEESKIKEIILKYEGISKIHKRILDESNIILEKPDLTYKLQGKRLLSISREALKRIFYLSYSYRMTKNKNYCKRAISELMNISSFPNWNSSHFLDVGEMAMAVAIGYDWLKDKMTPREKDYIINSLINNAFIPALDSKNSWFRSTTNNWNSVCNGGLVCSALAVAESAPEIANKILSISIESNKKILEAYNPDGGYPEGYGYWSYGTIYQVLLYDALKSKLGYNINKKDNYGFLRSAQFIQHMGAPSGKCFNFSDTQSQVKNTVASWWFASYLQDPSLIYQNNILLDQNEFNISEPWLLPCIPIFASRLNNLKISTPKDLYWYNAGKTPIFIYRSAWNNNGAFLAVKGGSPSTSHAHMDGGSFIYEYGGIRWADDLGGIDYYLVESNHIDLWNMTQNSQRWDIQRIANNCHNALTINNSRHNVKGNAIISRFIITDEYKGATLDLTSILNFVKCAHREVFLDENNFLNICDSLSSGDSPITLKWTMVTRASVKLLNSNQFLLVKDSCQMLVTISSRNDVSTFTSEINPLAPYDLPNYDAKIIGFTSKISSHNHATYKVIINKIK